VQTGSFWGRPNKGRQATYLLEVMRLVDFSMAEGGV